ncbi:NAD(P)H-hydrate dehydratase [Alkalilimnicola sp. S0819]|uniref:NAD(P)H-hydrate dehydratase n=1 Tax=Alkalilimnicola sp. S0819 TaxID=2613922 RepID=UPI0012617740|nr:NAD(P)H-hydrate dehydratase [Alkalilimnicola sp. S0819]KAB7628348.1 NAD(P)H-hydrate dehydratase [Alkalilimnicola sp. S0819]MPQ15249.1 NAD(P)H-hydrate dehydratase [Alkalilimnicola sp. S0819]
MSERPLELYSPEQVRELDRRAIAALGGDGYALMCRAGAAAWRVLRERYPRARQVRVVCGLGNNAGDGYVIARLARAAGLDATVLSLVDPARLGGSAARALADYRADGGRVASFQVEGLAGADVLVDAIFGIGLSRPLDGEWRAAVEALNGAAAPVLAVDVPSGLDAGTGAIRGLAVRARHTVSFIGLKAGLLTGAGPACCGELLFDGLGVPAHCHEGLRPVAWRQSPAERRAGLAPRPRDAHKGLFGHVLVVGGGPGMAGAVRLAGEAAARCGAGLVSVATRPEHLPAVLAGRPELMCAPVGSAAALTPLLARASVLVLGPGLGQGAWGRELFRACRDFAGPRVLDADALNLLADEPDTEACRVLTPHPGEAARLLACTTAEVQADRYAAVRALQQRYGGVVVLKGAGSLVCTGDEIVLCDGGNPGMASGGMGDVLSGVLGALLAQGLAPGPAARIGVDLHAQAADAAAARGERGLLASDLFEYLRELVNPDE